MNNLVFDLREKGELSSHDSKLIDELFPIALAKYNNFIGDLIKSNSFTELELLFSVTSRNPFVSPLLDIFSKLELLDKKVESGVVPYKIIVDQRSLEIFTSLLNKKRLNNVIISHHNESILRVVIFKNLIKSLYILFNSWFWPKIFKIKKPSGSIYYVDTFLMVDSIDENGNYNDRYYTCHEQWLTDEQNKNKWFVPTLYDIRTFFDYITIWKSVVRAKDNFLLQESFLTFFDYISSLYLSARIPFSIKEYPTVEGLNTQNLIRNLVYKDFFSSALVGAILRYKFIGKLRDSGVEVISVVDWYENQVIDKALNLSFRKFYPNTIVNGYQGFPVLPYYASQQPTCYELELGLVPHNLHVISDIYVKPKLDICNKLNVLVSPAFRYSYLFQYKNYNKIKAESTVLIALPGIIDECLPIMKMCSNLQEVTGGSVRILLKIHPQYSLSSFLKKVPNFDPRLFSITNKPLYELFKSISVLVTSGSSVSVEAISIGIPVAVCANMRGVTLNFIPDGESNELWSIVYGNDELESFVISSLRNNNRKKNVDRFFELGNDRMTQRLFCDVDKSE